MITVIITGRQYYTPEYDTAMRFARFFDGDVNYTDGGYYIIIPQ